MINFLNLEYFLVAAEELNFTKAAKKLFISQQSLSNHISNMEKEFDVILFNRTTPLTLTYAGQALKEKAKQMLELRDETYRQLADIKDFSVGQLTLGLSHTRGRVILPEILPVFKDRFPNIALKLVEGNSSELADALRHGEIDLIARDNEYLVFIEVKYRKGSWSGRALEAVNFAKQKTICKVARYFLAVEYHNVDIPCRFDVVGIDDKKVYWVKNAFEYMN